MRPTSSRCDRPGAASLAVRLVCVLGAIACDASSTGGGSGDDGGGGTSSNATSASTSASTSTPGAGGGGGDEGAGGAPYDCGDFCAAEYAWAWFQGELDSDDPDGTPGPHRRLVGCAVDAPELGDLVVYVERTDPAAPDVPDRQILMSFVQGGDALGSSATAVVHRPVDPTQWVGRCTPGLTLPLLGSVDIDDVCELSLELDSDVVTKLLVHSDGPVTAECFDPQAEASTTVAVGLVVFSTQIEWADEVARGGGTGVYEVWTLIREGAAPPLPD